MFAAKQPKDDVEVYISPIPGGNAVKVVISHEMLKRLPVIASTIDWKGRCGDDPRYCRVVCEVLGGCKDALRILAAYMCGLTGDDFGTRLDLDRCPAAVARAIYAAEYLGAQIGTWALRLVNHVRETCTPNAPQFDELRRMLLARNGPASRVLLYLCQGVLENAGWYQLVHERVAQSLISGAKGDFRELQTPELVRGRVLASVAAHDGPILGKAFKAKAMRDGIWPYVWHWFACKPFSLGMGPLRAHPHSKA